MGLMDFRPFVRVKINGAPLSGFAFSQVTSVRINDATGFVSDTAEIDFANVSALSRFVMPEPGALIEIEMGYLFGFRDMGKFIADEIEETGPNRSIRIVARAKSHGSASAGMGPIQQQKSRSWDAGLTLKSIVSTIATDNGLTAAVTEAAGAIVPGHLDQVDESDIAMLTRVAAKYDLIAKPAGGRLFVGRRSDAITATGSPMPVSLLVPSSVSSWSMRRSLGDTVGSVIAVYRDLKTAKDIEVVSGEGEPVRRLRQRFRTEEEARAVADAEARRAGRSVEALSMSMPGNPSLVAESKIVPVGFSSASAGEWVINNATHEVSDAGYQTSIRTERPK